MYARVVLGFSLATALVCGQGTTPTRPARPAPNAAPNTDSTPPKKPGTVEGVVINSVSGQPVKKATVTLRNTAQRFAYAMVSDLAGHFLFENVEPGPYFAMAAGDGFQPEMGRGSVKTFTVAEEQHVKDVAVKLQPLGLVSGRVLDEDGDPIAGANLQAMRSIYNQGRKQMSTWGYANSNDLGEFQMLDLQPGRYYFQVTAPSQQNNTTARFHGVEETYPATYYPSALDLAQATPVEVSAGAQLNNIDFRLRKIRSYGVRGKVVDGSGQAARNVRLQLMPAVPVDNSFSRMGATVQQDGTFQLRGVTSGSYIATCQRQEGDVTTFARQTINVGDQDVEGVLLVLVAGLEITGTVQVEGSEASPPPRPDTAQQAQPAQARSPQVTLQPLGGRGPGGRAAVETDNTFVLHNLMPNIFQVNVSMPGAGKYLKSIRFGERDVPNGQIDLTQGSGGSLTLVFGTDGGHIQGTVQSKNGDPAAGVMITMAPGEEFEGRGDLFKQTSTDQSGSFHFQDIAPGNYRVFAWEQYDFQTMQAPEFRKVFESRAARVSIGANGRESVQLKAISSEDIEAEKGKLP
jgi:protocatechuate 3,4-dioxygenase beta subunit